MTPRWSPNPRSLLRRQELLTRGVHPRRLASEEFTEVIPGFCTPTDAPADLQVIARVLQREVSPDAVISHVTAAELLRLPLPFSQRHDELNRIHCTVAPEKRRRLGPRVTVHARRPAPTRRWRGLTMSAPVELLSDLAGELTTLELVQACDKLVGPQAERPRVSLRELQELVDHASGIPGINQVRQAVTEARELVDSPKETELRLLLTEENYVEPEINVWVRAPKTGENFRLDLSYPWLKIAIEYDGDWHRTDRARHRRDRRKDDVLHELGWRVVRATDEDLSSPSNFLGRLAHLGAPQLRAAQMLVG
ncbi:DUF559 domain-containing protein [Brachybacterium fresconis]|uniref:Very-short-patch-repair endonuclease n=1 Tax=Brachybacterium fresconis TaxID=173363 RepID=A0ABS4YM13_9MICO|nr:DUF559 domain-containing protein [Brachybacterium fresconis]MBP2409437.1 very-short-patch-repair endonuclease [Brachybacterium fresconis]